ncbi:MAG TPA: hypothetical protein VKU01_33870 [Bryobacteraceae bacterium]|nr:hypothetical protein [Bryobacteraceae bacterium]
MRYWFSVCALVVCAFGGTEVFGQQQQQQSEPPKQAPAAQTGQTSDEPESGDGLTSVMLGGWYNPSHPDMKTGHGSTLDNPSNLDFPGKNQPTPYVVVTLPGGQYGNVRISYFRTQGHGNVNAGSNLSFFGTDYSTGDYLNVRSTLQNAKISWDYLTWPYPPAGHNWRVKLLFEAQYTTISSNFNAPLKPTVDSSGNPLVTTASGSNSLIYPTFGLAPERLLSKHLRWETRASGFLIPHHGTIWDAESYLAYKSGRFEFRLGGKAFHIKTSPTKEEYITYTLPGAFVGFCWYPGQ